MSEDGDADEDAEAGECESVAAVNEPREPTSALRPVSSGRCKPAVEADSDEGAGDDDAPVESAAGLNEPLEATDELRPLAEPGQDDAGSSGGDDDA
jgi:hypothetical protein